MIIVAKREKEQEEINIFQSNLVPKHETLNDEEKAELLKKLNIKLRQLPRMKSDDAALKTLNAKRGDVVRITRRSQIAGEYFYYRVVI